MQLHEALGQRLVEGIAGVVGGQVEVVERVVGATAIDHDVSSVQDEADVAGDVLLMDSMKASRERFSGPNQRPS